ncbi:MAG: hypothetical protein QM483_02535 [Desulfuromusa sp.]
MTTANQPSTSHSSQRRLGEHLQAAGLLTTEQLDEAIEYQCIYGGKLGTSLIELGLIDENQLAKTLSNQLKRHYIKPELLMNVSSSVLKLIPKETALKYQVVPYLQEGNKLFVALNETTNLSSIDELSFQLDHIIIPLAIPEIRLLLALKKHYGLQLQPRYETIARQINRRTIAAKKIGPKKSSQKKQTPPAAEKKATVPPADVSAWPLLGDVPSVAEEEPDNFYYDKSAQKQQTNPLSLFQKLASAQDREDIAKAIISYLKADFKNCALLMVRKEIAHGWLAAVENGVQLFEQIVISLQEDSVFGLVAKSGSDYLGPMTNSPQNNIILDFFASTLPQDVLVMPLTVQKRLVCILYIQGDLDVLERRLVEFKTIITKAEMSFKLLILKNKILTT